MRKIIFMGQSGEKAVYYNTRTKEALVADKSVFLDTEGARQSNGCIVPLILFFSFLGVVGGTAIIPVFNGFRNNVWMTIPYLIAHLFVLRGLIWLFEDAMYSEVKQVRPASEKLFAEAVDTNLFWENFSNKKITVGKFFGYFIVYLAVAMVTIVEICLIPVIINTFIAQEKFHISVIFSIISACAPAVLYLLTFQNNPFRWLLAVRQYEKGNVIFVEEEEEALR